MSITAITCWTIFFFIINVIDPTQTNILGFSSFYLSLSLALIGSIAILGFIIRFVWLKQELAFKAVIEAFRQSFLFTLFIVTSLFLLSQDLFDWINLILLIIILSIIEFYILGLTYKPRNVINKPEPTTYEK